MSRFAVLLLLLTNLYSEGIKRGGDEFIFPKWKNMNLLNKYLLESQDHDAYVDIYVNDIAKEPYILEKNNFPVGSIIVKPLYPKKKRENIARLVIMMKMKSGYDSRNNNWWYGVYDKSGMYASYKGKIKSCITCHAEAKDTDYMFSESVMYDIALQPVFKDSNTLHKPIKND